MLTFETLTDWVTAGAGIGAFLATGVLALLAYLQMRKLDKQGREQSKAMNDQVDSLREQVEAMKEQAELIRETSASDLRAVERQVEAAVQQGNAIREAARAQLQPVVFAHYVRAVPGTNDEYSLEEGEIGFLYSLSNEGTGTALDIRHGIEVDGDRWVWAGGLRQRALQPGETFPLTSPEDGMLIWKPLCIPLVRADLPKGWETRVKYLWVRFRNVFGDEFETRNPTYPNRPAEFRRIDLMEIDPPERMPVIR